jgi:UDP-perosamine 4-acetyltransferase
VVIEILTYTKNLKIYGLLDSNHQLHGKKLFGVPILGADDMLDHCKGQGISHFFVGTGGLPKYSVRRRLFELGCQKGLIPVAAIHPAAVLSSSSLLGNGITAMAGVVVNAEARVGDNVILNTGCVVEHESQIDAHAHIAPGAVVSGGVWVGEEAQVGAGAIVRQAVRIGPGAVVGAGAVVVKDVAPYTVVVGVPAQLLRKTGTSRPEAK